MFLKLFYLQSEKDLIFPSPFPTKLRIRLLNLLTDIDLWRSFKEGDRDAFGELFRRHYTILVQYGAKLCPDRTVVEDCIQELFTELWQKKPAATVQSVKAYLLTSVKYKL
jgi:RNA polymerase sigma-70 factor (ECF subfamily)